MTLLEVLVASLLVGVIALGTFSAFDAAGRTSADQRAHAQATTLAQQDEERLRAFTTTALAQLGSSEQVRAENGLCLEKPSTTWVYYNKANTTFCEKIEAFAGLAYTGTLFTVTSSARYAAAPKGAEKEGLTCETVGGGANYEQTTSSVSWSGLGSRTPVKQSSLVTNPTTGLLVKILNQNGEPVSGATVKVTGESTSPPSQVTPAAGCVTFFGLVGKLFEVAVEKGAMIDKAAKNPPEKKTGIALSTNGLTAVEFTMAEPGAIEAKFVDGKGVAGEGDTFYAYQSGIPTPSDFVGGVAGTFKEKEVLLPAPGRLFPFAKPAVPHEAEPYTVYAGDCSANNPNVVTAGAVPDVEGPVKPGATAQVTLEAPPVTLTVYEGTASVKKLPLQGSLSAVITNEACKTATAQNVVGKVAYTHKVAITTGVLESEKGHLKPKWQPYAAELILCVTAHIGTKYDRNTFKFANAEKGGAAEHKFYLKEVKTAVDTGVEERFSESEVKCP
jgi:type II secretory pathway pseudopilin PulG